MKLSEQLTLKALFGRNGPAEREFILRCQKFGLVPGDLGRTFCLNYETYTVAGMVPHAGSKQIIVTRSDGSLTRFNPLKVAQFLDREKRHANRDHSER